MQNGKPTVCFIGFGEAGQAIAAGLRDAGTVARMSAWDILFPKSEGEKLAKAADAIGVTAPPRPPMRCASRHHHYRGDRGIERRRRPVSEGASGRQAVFLDVNSVSPGRKQDTAKLIGDEARYVDVAVLAPIYPARHQTPMLLAGPHADAVAPTLAALGMRTTSAGPETGAAAAIKMVRSVMIKGIEALTMECFVAAARAGVIDEVAASLKNNYPGLDWAKVVPYNLERMASHGERRAAEMEEVADTLRELGVEPLMATATVKRQREMGQIGKQQAVRTVLDKDRTAMLNAISAAARDRH